MALLLLFPLSAGAQSNVRISGKVFDTETGAPIAGATVTVFSTAFRTITDEYGTFSFADLPEATYSIQVTCIGYGDHTDSDIRVKPDITIHRDIRLRPRVYHLGSLSVRDTRPPLSSDRVIVLNNDDIRNTRARDIPDVLTTVEGVLVQKTGGAGGRTEVKIRGGDAEQVLVLVDGQRINPSGTGTADVSTIPLDMVEKIEIHKGGASAEYGPDAFAGVISITTIQHRTDEPLQITAGRDWGQWKGEQYHLVVQNPIPLATWTGKFGYSLDQSVGDFAYAYSVPPRDNVYTGDRSNNQSEIYNYFASGSYRAAEKISIGYSGQYYRGRRGLPGWASKPNEFAQSVDRRALISTTVIYQPITEHGYTLESGYSHFEQHFYDRKTMPVPLQFDSRFDNDIITIKHTQRHHFLEGQTIRTGMEYRRDNFDHEDARYEFNSMGRSHRDNAAAFVSVSHGFDLSKYKLAETVALNAALRYDWTETRKDSTGWQDTVTTNSVSSWSPKVGLAVSGGKRLTYVLRASYGRSLRIPSINALFWKGDARSGGNPGLRPEKSEHSEAGLELSTEIGSIVISGGMTYFHSFLTDLIIWTTSMNVWRPENLQKAQITGHEDFLKLSAFDGKISLMYQNTITTAKNKDTAHTVAGRDLVFTPHYLTSLTARFDLKYVSGSYAIRWCDRAYTNEANTSYYDAYRVDDLTVGVRYDPTSTIELSADVTINNIRDVDYVLITHYPMPGREWRFGIGITFGLEK
ncbi:MAG: TonB-dependent receptor [candidate division Zixibacteria bacterium]|nr:TonB-dependent receptor [candidate division Zixibacteria bacterium]